MLLPFFKLSNLCGNDYVAEVRCFILVVVNGSLYVEEIDLGDIGVRQVVSGLAKYVKEEDMMV